MKFRVISDKIILLCKAPKKKEEKGRILKGRDMSDGNMCSLVCHSMNSLGCFQSFSWGFGGIQLYGAFNIQLDT